MNWEWKLRRLARSLDHSQEPRRCYRSASFRCEVERLTLIRQALAEAGFTEGRTVAMEYRWAGGQLDRLPELAVDLVSRKVNVIIATGGLQAPRAAMSATSTIPSRSTTRRATTISSTSSMPRIRRRCSRSPSGTPRRVWGGSKVCRPSTQRASKQRSRTQRTERGVAHSFPANHLSWQPPAPVRLRVLAAAFFAGARHGSFSCQPAYGKSPSLGGRSATPARRVPA